jgi:kumamolisin
MHRFLAFSLPLVLLACVAAAVSPSSAVARVKGDTGLSHRQVGALIELRHPRGLNRFVRAVSDPASPRYRQYATVEQLVARFGAKPRAKQRVLRWLSARGLDGTVSRSGTFITTTLPRGRAAELPRGGAVARVTLLPPGSVLNRRPSPQPGPTASGAAAAKKKPYSSVIVRSGTPKGCAASRTGGYEPGVIPVTPNQYTTAYGHAAMHARGLRGEGQTVAVVEAGGGFRHSDITVWAKCFGLKPPPIRVVPVAPVKKPLPGELETTLDLEMLTAGAPGLDRILVYEGGESNVDVIGTIGTALGDSNHRPDVISISLGFCEPAVTDLALRDAIDDILAVAAGAGISVLVSAGDQGSSGCRVGDAETEEETALPITAVSLPASSPYATAVGGTNVLFTAKNRIKLEAVWNDQLLTPWGGGGGISLLSPRTPWWQEAVGDGVGRKVPDIAALADLIPGYAFFCTAPGCGPESGEVFGWFAVGGTSAAAPLTAAGIALANQLAERRGQPTLGFLNPLLYELGGGAGSSGAVFSDVTVGNNDIGRALPPQAGGGVPLQCCQAKTGYDRASGWGSLKIPGFASAAAAAVR